MNDAVLPSWPGPTRAAKRRCWRSSSRRSSWLFLACSSSAAPGRWGTTSRYRRL
ncbi:hypothetical protein PF003_g31169 [Phytophthora fragariae]|nr:hypothetical protein PF003_g31169 [Phytophthora fragariae]